MHVADSSFSSNDVVVFLLLGIATMMDISKVNSYLYTMFLLIGIILGIISIFEKIKKRK